MTIEHTSGDADVDAACEAVRARGERVTVRRVVDHLGSGSFTQITPLVRAWNEIEEKARAAVRSATSKPAMSNEPAPMPMALQRSVPMRPWLASRKSHSHIRMQPPN